MRCASITSCTARWMPWRRSVRPAGQRQTTDFAIVTSISCCDSLCVHWTPAEQKDAHPTTIASAVLGASVLLPPYVQAAFSPCCLTAASHLAFALAACSRRALFSPFMHLTTYSAGGNGSCAAKEVAWRALRCLPWPFVSHGGLQGVWVRTANKTAYTLPAVFLTKHCN